MTASLTPERVRELLAELAARVAAAGDGGTAIRVVGGAAIPLLDPARRATSDVDAVVSGSGDVDAIVAAMAACEVRTAAQAQGIYERYHHQEVLSPVAQARVEHWLENLAD